MVVVHSPTNHLGSGALACLLADPERMTDATLAACADELGVPLRFVVSEQALPPLHQHLSGIRLYRAERPLDVERIGQRRGRLTVVGLGPGAAEFMVPATRRALDEAEARRKAQVDTVLPPETGGRRNGPEPTRYGDWEKKGILSDF